MQFLRKGLRMAAIVGATLEHTSEVLVEPPSLLDILHKVIL